MSKTKLTYVVHYDFFFQYLHPHCISVPSHLRFARHMFLTLFAEEIDVQKVKRQSSKIFLQPEPNSCFQIQSDNDLTDNHVLPVILGTNMCMIFSQLGLYPHFLFCTYDTNIIKTKRRRKSLLLVMTLDTNVDSFLGHCAPCYLTFYYKPVLQRFPS